MANSVEWLSGDYPPIAYGTSPGDIISLSGTVEIIGTPVTFRAYSYVPAGPVGEMGSVSTSISIGNSNVGITSRYIEAEPTDGSSVVLYSTSFILPAGIYNWEVLCTFAGDASVNGEGGIDWAQAPDETPTPTPTPTPTNTKTPTPTPTKTPTQTPTNTKTPTQTPTKTPTQTPTNTKTPTQTPSSPPIICGLGLTTGTYYYTNCCNIFVQGTQTGLEVSFDYTKPFAGVTKLNSRTTVACSTPTPTPTPTTTPTNTKTPTQTPTNTPTRAPSNTPSNTPSNSPVVRLKNECNVITLFEMGISCNIIQLPSDANPDGGIVSINVTGGTAPYTFTWAGGQRSQTLFGVPAGDYEVIVTDYNWPDGSPDYTATTICKLLKSASAPSPSQTPTPTPTSPVKCVDLCLIAIGPIGVPNFGPIQFVCNGTQNGRFKWTGGGYDIIWNVNNSRWQIYISGTTTPVNLGGGILVSTSFELIPDSAWTILGGTVQYSITMTKGNCPTVIPLQVSTNKTNNSCQGSLNCNGSISILAENGYPPYSYSINGGITYGANSNFTTLCPNSYTVVVLDSQNNSQTRTVIIGNTSTPVTYQLSLANASPQTVNTVNNVSQTLTQIMNLVVSPTLPVGLSISFNLSATDLKTINGPGSATSSMIWSVNKNNTPINTTVGPVVPVSQGTRPNCSPNGQIKTSISYNNSITITNGDVVTVTATTVATITNGQVASQTNCTTNITDLVSANILTPVISGNDCSSVIGSGSRIVFDNNFTYVPNCLPVSPVMEVTFWNEYAIQVGSVVGPKINFTSTFISACNALEAYKNVQYPNSASMYGDTRTTQSPLSAGSKVYADQNITQVTTCSAVRTSMNGYFVTNITTNEVTHIVNGIVQSVNYCP